MVWHHVAQGAGGLVESAAVFDTHSLRRGDLHVVDVRAVPERFNDAVGETKHQDILDGFFAEVMVDAVDLLFGEDFFQFFVELNRGFVIVAEGLFHDDAHPVTTVLLGQADLAELADNGREKLGSDREIMKQVALRAVILLDGCDLLLQSLVGGGVSEISLNVVDTIEEPLPERLIERSAGKLSYAFRQLLPE